MRLTNRTDIKITIFGLIISCVLLDMIVFPLTHIIFKKTIDAINLDRTIYYVLWAHFSIFISGLFIGFSRASNKLLVTTTVGALYIPVSDLLMAMINPSILDLSIMGFVIGGAKNIIAALIGLLLAYLIIKRGKLAGTEKR